MAVGSSTTFAGGGGLVRAVFGDRGANGEIAATVIAVRFHKPHRKEPGQIELYTLGPDGLEEFLRYVRPVGAVGRCRTDERAEHEIGVAACGDMIDATARYAQIEL